MTFTNSNDAISSFNLWFKQRDGSTLSLTDVSRIIPLRWAYFRDNWEFIRPDIEDKADSASNPDLLRTQCQELSAFIESQRNITSILNPFGKSSILFRFYEVFDNINIEDINITKEENKIVEEATNRVASFNRNDFLEIRSTLAEERDIIADLTGTGDADYDSIFNRKALEQQRDVAIKDVNAMRLLQETIDSVNFVLANSFYIPTSSVDPFELARQNANNPEINIGQYTSGTLVRFNYGESLETMAAKYLGDPDKWVDLAIANGLKPPYVDEVGEVLTLISNGRGTQLSITAIDAQGLPNINKLYLNQSVVMRSTTSPIPERRYIRRIKEIQTGEIVVELSGDADLSKYKIDEGATFRVFKSNTINSDFFLLIPSNEPVDTVTQEKVPWFLETSAEDEKRAQVDLLIGDDGDLKFTQSNDLQLSYGLANAIQALKLKVGVELGGLIRHQDFGLPPVQGKTNDKANELRDLLVDSITRAIDNDKRFDRIETLNVAYFASGEADGGGTGFYITMSVRLAGGGKVVPISFSVNTSIS